MRYTFRRRICFRCIHDYEGYAMRLTIDHISYATTDLQATAAALREQFGLDAVEGGSHPEWGTANLIVPLGANFIELVGVTDLDVAMSNPVGQAVAERAQGGARPLGLCLRAEDIAAEAARLALPLLPGERRYADGRVLRWQQMGIAEAISTPGIPYFFEYDDQELRLGAVPPRHDVEPVGILGARIAVDPARFAGWTAGAELPIEFLSGGDGLQSIDVALGDGTSIRVGATSVVASA